MTTLEETYCTSLQTNAPSKNKYMNCLIPPSFDHIVNQTNPAFCPWEMQFWKNCFLITAWSALVCDFWSVSAFWLSCRYLCALWAFRRLQWLKFSSFNFTSRQSSGGLKIEERHFLFQGVPSPFHSFTDLVFIPFCFRYKKKPFAAEFIFFFTDDALIYTCQTGRFVPA